MHVIPGAPPPSSTERRIAFTSHHAAGDCADGALTIGVGIEDDALGQTVWDTITFSVPRDFHAHNDAVAAALLTLAGRRCAEVTFNFPISTFCAATLRAYYGDIAIGPIDPDAPPRAPGRRIGVNFSGGVDSVAVWLLLRELYGHDVAVVTSDYAGGFEFERRGFLPYRRDVTCHTDFRRKRYHREGRFNFCVPLLFADYLDLWGIATGHSMSHTPDGVADYRSGERPAFLHGDLVVNAGGLADVHLLRPLNPPGVLKVLMTLGPERIANALAGSSPPNSGKPYTSVLILRHLYADAGLPLPAVLRDYPPLRRPMPHEEFIIRLLYLCRRDGVASVAAYCPSIRQLDLAFLDRVSLRFLERYSPLYIDLLPGDLPERLPHIFHACGILPYDDHDWEELAIVRRFLKANIERYRDLPD